MKKKIYHRVMAILLLAVNPLAAQGIHEGEEQKVTTKMLINFADKNDVPRMVVVNDGVMGGLSQGAVVMTQDGTVLFKGTLSLENNGGFSSFRIADRQWDLSENSGVEVWVKGDGRTYGLRVTTNEKFLQAPVAFTADFQTVKGHWVKARIPFAEMKASWRGRKLTRRFDPSQITGIGVILADNQAGGFALEIKSISTWK